MPQASSAPSSSPSCTALASAELEPSLAEASSCSRPSSLPSASRPGAAAIALAATPGGSGCTAAAPRTPEAPSSGAVGHALTALRLAVEGAVYGG